MICQPRAAPWVRRPVTTHPSVSERRDFNNPRQAAGAVWGLTIPPYPSVSKRRDFNNTVQAKRSAVEYKRSAVRWSTSRSAVRWSTSRRRSLGFDNPVPSHAFRRDAISITSFCRHPFFSKINVINMPLLKFFPTFADRSKGCAIAITYAAS